LAAGDLMGPTSVPRSRRAFSPVKLKTFLVAPSLQETLERTAANLDKLADYAAGVMSGKPKVPGGKAG
jgi:hypothetical protein